ncbi:MAG: GntR family transcriptional regulator [Acidimicrobiaceae bacterium]|nr:MAG: GntR family transcriptional regulator [Acidimicrobiaceae bacterium]
MLLCGPMGSTDSVPTHRHVGAINHLPLRHAVFVELRARIMAGDWSPGERLFEDQIATDLEVSRNPVREALQALAAEGFVELEPRRGARVAVVSAGRANELFEMREALEGLVARLAAQRRTEEQLAELRSVVAAGLDAAARHEHDRLPALNTRFHHCLSAAAGNSMLSDSIDHLSHIIEWVYSRSVAGRSAQSWAEHHGIVEAIGHGDPEHAHSLACAHISQARTAYLNATAVGG